MNEICHTVKIYANFLCHRKASRAFPNLPYAPLVIFQTNRGRSLRLRAVDARSWQGEPQISRKRAAREQKRGGKEAGPIQVRHSIGMQG